MCKNGIRRLLSWFTVLAMLFSPAAGSFSAPRAETAVFRPAAADRDTEYLDMGAEIIRDWEAFFSFLRQFPRLKKVDLFTTEVRPEQIRKLTEAFPEIEFGMTMRLQEHVVRTDATAFSTLHTSGSPRHRDEELSPIRYCRHLRALDLGHNRLTDLSFLYDLPELRVLILSMNELTDITPIGALKHLEYLELFNNRITDIGVLADLPYLMDLNIVHNHISDLRPLEEMRTLKMLWMKDANYLLPAKAMRKTARLIQQALPACEISATSGSIEGNWRKGPHYEVIRRIFASGEYEPFIDSPKENR